MQILKLNHIVTAVYPITFQVVQKISKRQTKPAEKTFDRKIKGPPKGDSRVPKWQAKFQVQNNLAPVFCNRSKRAIETSENSDSNSD